MTTSQHDHTRTPGRPRNNSQGLPLEQTILHTASRLFMEQGYETVSLMQIAKACGVTKASVYYYFSNKAQLFTSSVLFTLELANRHTALLLQEDLPLRQRLEQIAVRKMQRTHIDMETMMREASKQLNEEQIEAIKQAEHTIHEELAKHFQLAIEAGEMRKGDALFLAHAFSSMLMMANRGEILFSSGAEHHELPRLIVDLFWQGVQPPAEPRA